MKKYIYKLFFFLSIIEGAFTLFFIFYSPSEKERAFLWGYSLERLALGGIILLVLILFIILFIWSWIAPQKHKKILTSLNEKFDFINRLPEFIIWMAYLAITELSLVFLLFSPLAPHLNALRFYLIRILPLLLWSIAILLQVIVVLSIKNASALKGSFHIQTILKALIVPSILTLALVHWAVLYFQIHLFLIIDGWFWLFRFKEAPNLWLSLPIFIISLGVVFIIIKSPQRTKRNLVLLIILGYFLQMSFCFIEADGIDTIRLRYMRTGHKSYALYASDHPKISDVFSKYEEIYSSDFYAGTKPPGVILFYIFMQRTSALFFPQNTFDMRVEGTVTFISYFYPFLACLTIPVLYRFSRLFLDVEKAIIPSVLYIFFPNFLLMAPYIDHALYPLLFILTLDLIARALLKNSLLLAFLSGVAIYIAIYFTFSLLPLIFLAIALFGISYISQEGKNIKKYLFLGLSLSAGLLIAILFFYFILDYKFLTRYEFALSRHREVKFFQSGILQILNASLLNNVEFAISIGFPIAVLALLRVARSIKAFLKKTMINIDILTLAFASTYLALLLVGQTRGEVGRLWLYFNPLIAIFAGIEAYKLFKNPKRGIFFIITLESITTMFIFKFQDFFA